MQGSMTRAAERGCAQQNRQREWAALRSIMVSTLIIVLLVLWLLGLVTSYTLGGLIHILLVVAIVMVLIRVIQGRNPLRG